MGDQRRASGLPLPGAATVLLAVVAAVAGWMVWQSGQAVREREERTRHKQALADPDATFRQRLRAIELWVEDGAAAIPEMVREARNPSPDVRAAAAFILGRIRPASGESVAALMQLLEDSDGEVRLAAFSAVRGLIASDEVDLRVHGPALLRMLDDPDEVVRSHALAAIGRLALDATGWDEVLRLLRSGQPDARRLALQVITGKREELDRELLAAIRGLLGHPVAEVRDEAFQTLAAFGAVRRDEALDALASDSLSVRFRARNVLEVFGPHAAAGTDRLRVLLRSSEDVLTIMDVLAGIGPAARSAIPDLLDVINGLDGSIHEDTRGALRDGEVRAAAQRTLARIASDEHLLLPLLRRDLASSNPVLVRSAGGTLAQFFPKRASAEAARIIALIEESDAPKRPALLRSLGALGPAAADAVPVVVEFLDDPATRSAALDALFRIGPAAASAVPTLVELLDDPAARYQVLTALERIGPAAAGAVPTLEAQLEASRPAPSSDVLAALQSIGARSARGERFLIGFIERELSLARRSPYPSASMSVTHVDSAVAALGRIAGGSEAAYALVSRLIDDEDAFAPGLGPSRSRLVTCLVELDVRRDETMNVLLEQASHRDVRYAVAWALGRFPEYAERSVPVLITFLEDPDPRLQMAAAQSLGRMGELARGAIPALREMARSATLRTPRAWRYVSPDGSSSDERHLETIWRAAVPDPAGVEVAELAALPLSAAAKTALEQIDGAAAPVVAPRPE